MKKKEKLKKAINLASYAKESITDPGSVSLELSRRIEKGSYSNGWGDHQIGGPCYCVRTPENPGGCKSYYCKCYGIEYDVIVCPDGFLDYHVRPKKNTT